MAVGSFLGSTLLQSRADASALLGGLGHWTRRPKRDRAVRIEYGGDQLEVSGPSTADQERLIELWLERHGEAVSDQAGGPRKPDRKQPTTPAVGTEHAPQTALPPAVEVSATGKALTVIEGEPARVVIRLVITLVVLAIAITAILAKTSADPAWGAIGAVVGYWLR
jgi:hypothetical protein